MISWRLLIAAALIHATVANFLSNYQVTAIESPGVGSKQNQTNATTKLQARISLESNSFDLDEKLSSFTNSDPPEGSTEASYLTTTTITSASNTTISPNKTRKKAKKERSSRRLSNIWSMFLPSSSSSASDTDYDESLEGEETGSETVQSAENGPSVGNTTTAISAGSTDRSGQRPSEESSSIKPPARAGGGLNLTEASIEKHDERLVAKYSRPPRQDGNTSSEFVSTGPMATGNQVLRSPSTTSSQDQWSGANFTSTTTVASAPSTMAPNSKNDAEPVQLITGSLSKDIGSIAPNMNDIVSNIANSMNWSPSGESGTNKLNQSSSGAGESMNSFGEMSNEREGEEEKGFEVRNRTTMSNENSNFERWLNRIQFQETTTPLMASSNIQATTEISIPRTMPAGRNKEGSALQQRLDTMSTTKMPPPTSQFTSIRWPQSFKNNQSIEAQRLAEALDSMRLKQQQQQSKTQPPVKPARLVSSPQDFGGTKGGSPNHSMYQRMTMSSPNQLNRLAAIEDQNLPQQSNNKMQHPFQQQLRQQQAQLIHGIKYPAAQASTISVSTQDGASNTSLSFAPNLSSIMGPMSGNEISQVVGGSSNGTTSLSTSNLMASSEEGGTVEQSVYQSQDEILRQVTSAINFEQQLNQNKRPEVVNNHRRPGEMLASNNDIESPDQISKLFKVGTSINELVDPATTTTSTTTPATNLATSSTASTLTAAELLKAGLRQVTSTNNNNNNNNASVLGTDDIDKNFDLLADRLRALAQQQQQQLQPQQQQQQQQQQQRQQPSSNSAQPTWLRRPNQADISGADLASANLTRLAASLLPANSNSLPDSSGGQPISLEHVRELLNKHERSKNELKSSHEAMGQLMQQLMLMESSKNNNTDKSQGLDKQHSHQIQQRQNAQAAVNSQAQNQAAKQQQNQAVTSAGSADQQISGPQNQQNQQQQTSDDKPASNNNIGWTPVMPAPPGSVAAVSSPPPSPANLLKNKFKQPFKLSQMNDNIGVSKDFANDEFYMNQLALMFASSQQANEESNKEVQPNPHIIGLPIAIVKETEEEDLANGLPQALQLEAMAEQLADHQNRQLLRNNQKQHHHHHLHHQPPQQHQLQHPASQHQFAPRLAGHHHPIQAHLQPQSQLGQVQQILQAYSPQTFLQQPTPRTPYANLVAARQNIYHQHQPLNNMASLIHEHNPHDQSPFMANFMSANNNYQAGKMIELAPNDAPIESLHQQQHQQLQQEPQQQQPQQQPPQQQIQAQPQQQTPPQPQPIQPPPQQQQQLQAKFNGHQTNQEPTQAPGDGHLRQYNIQRLPDFNTRQHMPLVSDHRNRNPQVNDEFRLQRQAQQQHQQHQVSPPTMMNYINSYPMRPMHEQTITGLRAPVIATSVANVPPVKLREVSLYKPFGFRTHHSIAYQASPAMAAMFPSRPSVLRHMTPFRAAYNGGQRLLAPLMQNQFHDHHHHRHSLLSSLPVPPPIRQPYARSNNQLKRQSHAPINHQAYASNRLEVQQQFEPPIELEGDNLMDDNFDQNNFEEVKFIPMDGSNDATIENEDLHLIQRPLSTSVLEKKTMTSRPTRQQRDDSSMFSSTISKSNCIRPSMGSLNNTLPALASEPTTPASNNTTPT